jgi:hypothetical protein
MILQTVLDMHWEDGLEWWHVYVSLDNEQIMISTQGANPRCKGESNKSDLTYFNLELRSRPPALEKVGAVTAKWLVDRVQSGVIDQPQRNKENPCLLLVYWKPKKPLKPVYYELYNLGLAG